MNDITSANALDNRTREKTIVRTSLVGVFGNIALVAIKMLFGILSASVSLISDAINNATDILSSLVTIIGTKLSRKKADKDHPFGHGRIEYLTTMVVALIIFGSGIAAIIESVKALIELYGPTGSTTDYSNLALIMVSVGIVIKLGIGLFYRIMGKKTQSEVLKASSMDALWDVVLSTSTLVCALITRFAGVSLEGYFGIAIGLFILKSGISFIIKGANEIIGHKTEPWLVKAISDLLSGYPEVESYCDLIINEYGETEGNGSMHIVVRDDMSAREIHDLTKKIEAQILESYNIVMTVGIYASGNIEGLSYKIKTDLDNILATFESHESVHGFYVDETKKNITFDLIWKVEEKSPEEMSDKVKKHLEKLYPDYSVNVVTDRNYSE